MTESFDFQNDTPVTVNYYSVIQKHLQALYPSAEKEEINALCREVIFAPQNYEADIDGRIVPISDVRRGLADFIEREQSNKNFIPYSLDVEIADLIESSNCETSSMNEYYRWVGAAADIVRHTGDGKITRRDVTERKDFIAMSYDREAEILLCLSLYEGAGIERNREKIEMLRYKLARLRELRCVVSNTANRVTERDRKEKMRVYKDYLQTLLMQKGNYLPDVNFKLKLNIEDSNDEDLEEGFSYLAYLQDIVLRHLRFTERLSFQKIHSVPDKEKISADEKSMQPICSRGTERY